MKEILVLIIFENNEFSKIELFSSCTRLCNYVNENILSDIDKNLNVNNIEFIDELLNGTKFKGTKIKLKTIHS